MRKVIIVATLLLFSSIATSAERLISCVSNRNGFKMDFTLDLDKKYAILASQKFSTITAAKNRNAIVFTGPLNGVVYLFTMDLSAMVFRVFDMARDEEVDTSQCKYQ